MDAHIFRIVGQELLALLEGARIEKIHGPLPEVLLFSLFAKGEKRRLIFQPSRSRPFLFFSNHPLTNPARPRGDVMRLRKYIAGRRLGKGLLDWSSRRIAVPVFEQSILSCWLCLDLRDGASILPVLPQEFGRAPAWPELDIIDRVADFNESLDDLWQSYTVLTPLLRETLATLATGEDLDSLMEARALLVDLESGGTELFVYADRAKHEPIFYSAWPLPESVLKARHLELFCKSIAKYSHNINDVSEFAERGNIQQFIDIVQAVTIVDEPVFFEMLTRVQGKDEVVEAKRAQKRIKRLANKLAQEEIRLQAMAAMKSDACLLQAHIWELAKNEKLAQVELADLDNPEIMRTIILDERLSIQENMQSMFKQASKGERGLGILQQRRGEIFASTKDSAQVSIAQAKPTSTITEDNTVKQDQGECGPYLLSASFLLEGKNNKQRNNKSLKNVALFRSSDGYLLLRGKNAEGNYTLLKLSQPHDLWMHAREGVSAHLIIRRAHAADEVPARTLQEAGRLVGEKSGFSKDSKVDIIVAYRKYVSPVKGAKAGTVRVEQELQNLVVFL